MEDKFLKHFLKKMPRTDIYTPVTNDIIIKYKNKVADRLLEYWRVEGFRVYGDGIIRIANPEQYDEFLKNYLKGTPFEKIDTFHIIFRGAFGNMRVVGENTGGLITISTPDNAIIALKNNFKKPQDMESKNHMIQSTFSMVKKDKFDYFDIKTNQSLFDQAYEKFGMLKDDEVYAFKRRLCDGGVPTIDNIQVENIFEYILDIRERCGTPKVPFSGANIDVDKLV